MAQKATSRVRNSEPLSTRVYRSLVERLRNGALMPGTRLREEDLAAELGVSRTPIREALTRLQARGLAIATPAGLAVPELTRPHVSELYAMRAVVEGAAARFAAENASAGNLVSLRHAGNLFSAPQRDPSQFARVNMMFHEAIYEAAHNSYLSRMVEDLNDSLALLPRTTFLVPGRLEAARVEHTRILEAIEKRDPDRAEQAARAHIRNALEGRLKLIFTLRASDVEGNVTP